MKTEREYFQHDVKWLTLDNESGTDTLRQHGYIPFGDGNKALCSGLFAAAPDETPLPHNELIYLSIVMLIGAIAQTVYGFYLIFKKKP